MTLDGVLFQDIDRIKERGRRLGIIKDKDKVETADLLYIDLVWKVLDVSHDLDTNSDGFEIRHKKMLQFGNLNKILATYEQVRAKKMGEKKEEGLFAQVVKKFAEEDKRYIEQNRKEAEKNKKLLETAIKKVMKGEQLTEEEQMIYDAGIEAGEGAMG